VPGSGSLYGYEVDSAFPLTRLVAGPGPRGRVELRRGSRAAPEVGPIVHSWSDGDVTFVLRRSGRKLHASCSVTGEFVVDGEARLIEAAPNGAPDEVWEHRMVATAFPLLAAERGDVVAHAAAIEVGTRAVVFLGPPRRGKSTVAAAAAGLGYRLLAEDGAAIELAPDGALVWPGPTGIRVTSRVMSTLGLVSDGGGDRKRTHLVPSVRHAEEPVPLGGVVVLGERGAPALTPLEPAAAVPSVVPSLIFGGSDRLGEAFRGAARLVSIVPAFRACLLDDLSAVRAELSDLLSRLADGVPSAAARGS
jgi:hypothetical protein